MTEQTVIGMDLGVTATTEMAVATGTTIEGTRTVPSSPRGFIEGFRRAAKDRPVAIVVESTAMSWFVAAVAAVRSGVAHTLYRVSGAKAAALRSFYRRHTKTDHIDARVLARIPAVDDSLRRFSLPEPEELALKRLVVLRHKLTVEETRVANRIRSTLHWAAPGLVQAAGRTVSIGLLSVLERWSDLRFLARASTSTIRETARWTPERARAVRAAAVEAVEFYRGFVDFDHLSLELQVALGQLEVLRVQRVRLEKRIARLHEQRHPNDHLLTVPGVGPVVAGIIRAAVGTLERFANVAAFRAYTGLVPREDSSGEARRRGRISKAGPSVLRWALYLAADAARRTDPALTDLYRRLMERGRTHTQALCAVATHLASRIWAVVREDRPYEWRDLDGSPISRDQARAIALSMQVDLQTRERLRARNNGGPQTPRSRQREAPHDAGRPSGDKAIEMALELVGGA